MTEETVSQPVSQPKKRGRPRKHPDIIGPEPKPTEKVAKPRPPCELKPREYEHRKVVWGIRAENPKFKQKGIAVLHKESEGDMVILMPVTKDNPDDDIRWRYRYIPGPAPYQYAMIDLEPEQGNNLGDILIELGTALKEGVKEWFGSVQAAAKTSEDFIKTVHDDKLGDKIKRHGIW